MIIKTESAESAMTLNAMMMMMMMKGWAQDPKSYSNKDRDKEAWVLF